MEIERNQAIIDVKTGSITSEASEDKVILVGTYKDEDNNFVRNLEIVLDRDGETLSKIKVPYDGYHMQLFVGEFTGDKCAEVMLRGSLDSSNGHEIGVVYKYENESLVEIFNHDQLNEKNRVNEAEGEEKKSYLDSPSGIYPIKQVHNTHYQLLIEQRVVGDNPSDSLGDVQILAELKDSEYKMVSKGMIIPKNRYRSNPITERLKYKEHTQVKYGDIDGDSKIEKVTLIEVPDENSNNIKELSLIIEKEKKEQKYQLNLSGSKFKLKLENLFDEKCEEIIITGKDGDKCKFMIFIYKDNKLMLLASDEKVNKALKFEASYLDNYKVNVKCLNNNKEYILDISKEPKEKLNVAYDESGKVKAVDKPRVDVVICLSTLYKHQKGKHFVQIRNNIIGLEEEIIGIIQTEAEFGERVINLLGDQYLLVK